MVSFADLLASMKRSTEHTWSLEIADSWKQGRTTYGGLSAALCLQAIHNNHTDLPPLRSAQINFIGPADGIISITSNVLRRGKSVSFISAEIRDNKGLSTQTIFCFGASRDSKLDHNFVKAPEVADPSQSTDLFKFGKGPAFTQNFECLHAAGGLPISGSQDPEFYLWVRHKDRSVNDLSALLCLADMAPPAIMTMFNEVAPVSSMTWSLNFLDHALQTNDGWWLLNSSAEHAQEGYSSQTMRIWNHEGKLVTTGKQSVALFY